MDKVHTRSYGDAAKYRRALGYEDATRSKGTGCEDAPGSAADIARGGVAGSAGRIKWVFAVLAVLFAVLMWRVAYIQLAKGGELARLCLSQQLVPIYGISLRGQVYDRNLTRLTESENRYYCFLLREEFEADGSFQETMNAGGWENVSKGAKSSYGTESSGKYVAFRTDKYDEEGFEALRCRGAYILSLPERSAAEGAASGVIGALNEAGTKGVSGIERDYNAYLERVGGAAQQIFLFADVNGKLLPGKEPVIGGTSDCAACYEAVSAGLVLTLDGKLQNDCFEALKSICAEYVNEGVTGGSCMVNEAQTGQILAMVSFGKGGAKDGEQEARQGGAQNKALSEAYSPGTLPEIIKGVCEYDKRSEGSIEVGAERGVTYLHFLDLALRLGLGEKILTDSADESTGHLPYSDEVGERGLDGITKGGGGVLVTPVQVAQMISIQANGGKKQPISLVLGYADEEGSFQTRGYGLSESGEGTRAEGAAGDAAEGQSFVRPSPQIPLWNEAAAKEVERTCSAGLVGSDCGAKGEYGAFFSSKAMGVWDVDRQRETSPVGWTAGYFHGRGSDDRSVKYVITVALEGDEKAYSNDSLTAASQRMFSAAYRLLCED